MPKIDAPDVKTGYWTALGVILALLTLAVLSMVWRTVKGRSSHAA